MKYITILSCLLCFCCCPAFSDSSLKTMEVEGTGKMVVYSVVSEDEVKRAPASRSIEVYQNEYDSFLVYVQGLLIRLNRDEFVREARISEDESVAVFLIWRFNHRYGGSDYSRIIAVQSSGADSSKSSFEYIESLDSEELNEIYEGENAFITSLGIVTNHFLAIQLFVHRKRSQSDLFEGEFETWNLKELKKEARNAEGVKRKI